MMYIDIYIFMFLLLGDLRLLNWSKKAIPGFRREGTTVSRNQKVEGPLEDFQPIKREK